MICKLEKELYNLAEEIQNKLIDYLLIMNNPMWICESTKGDTNEKAQN